MKADTYSRMLLIYKKHSSNKNPNKESQMCLLWPTDDPPDILEYTEPIEDIENEFDIQMSEMEAVKMYDMSLLEASEYISDIIKSE